jgi:hypothetical protein
MSDTTGPGVFLVLDLYIVHERWGSTSKPILNGHLNYPRTDGIDRPLNETTPDKIRDYRTDYNNRPSKSISSSFMSVVGRTSDRLHCDDVCISFL